MTQGVFFFFIVYIYRLYGGNRLLPSSREEPPLFIWQIDKFQNKPALSFLSFVTYGMMMAQT